MALLYKIQRYLACLFVQRKKELNLSEAVISFTFDDAPDSAFLNGATILKKYGFQGTYFVSLGLAEKERPGGAYFDVNHLKKVVEDGGELGCHTYDHIHLYTSGRNELKADLRKNEEKIKELIPGYRFVSFAYPFGEQTLGSKMLIRDRYKCARSIRSGINTRYADLNNLKALQLYEGMRLDRAFAFIDKTIESKGWLVFFTHDVQKNPSLWGCTPEYFERIVKYCSERKLKACTIAKVVEMIPDH
jgi:peptidoglycan/xylan/chitin deacetylase (PgdA/CDA1 family)